MNGSVGDSVMLDESELFRGANATPLTISVPLKVGPTKNIY